MVASNAFFAVRRSSVARTTGRVNDSVVLETRRGLGPQVSLADTVEEFFRRETALAGRFLAITAAQGFAARRQWTIQAADELLTAFALEPAARRQLLAHLCRKVAGNTVADEFSTSATGTAADALTTAPTSAATQATAALVAQAIATNRAASAELVVRLKQAAQAGALGMSLESLVAQLLHIRVHLLLRSSSEQEELAVYEALRDRSTQPHQPVSSPVRAERVIQVHFAAGGAVGCVSSADWT